MNDDQLLRYSRQIMLPQCDIAGQQRLLGSKALIVGAGGLGSPASMYLAVSGVGNLIIYDNDQVDLSNLQRQIAQRTADVGMAKVISTRQTLHSLNPEINVRAEPMRLQGDKLLEEISEADVVLDCSDNFATRFAINEACVKLQKPLVSGAAIRFEGQVAVFTPNSQDSPCYNCLYQRVEEEDQSCSTQGVIAPITGIIGSYQALEAIKLITGMGQPMVGKLLLIDGLSGNCKVMQLRRNPHCPTCGQP